MLFKWSWLQILDYQYGVLPSKSTQGAELARRPRAMLGAGRSVPSCAGRGWAAATGPGIMGGHLESTGTPVSPWRMLPTSMPTLTLCLEIETVEKNWNWRLPVQLTWSIHGPELVVRPQKMWRHGRTAPSCAKRELHVATGPGTMTRHPTCTGGINVWPWPMLPALMATRTPCPAPGTVPAMMRRRGAMLPSSSTRSCTSCTGSWLCMIIQGAWNFGKHLCQIASNMTRILHIFLSQ